MTKKTQTDENGSLKQTAQYSKCRGATEYVPTNQNFSSAETNQANIKWKFLVGKECLSVGFFPQVHYITKVLLLAENCRKQECHASHCKGYYRTLHRMVAVC